VKALFDSNILIDYLNGFAEAKAELGLYSTHLISDITWIEVLAGVDEDEERRRVRGFLDLFEIAGISERVREEAVEIRRTRRLRLPDALIWATARSNDALLVTRNTRDFPADDPGVREPYRI
jgi:hypothetical protein